MAEMTIVTPLIKNNPVEGVFWEEKTRTFWRINRELVTFEF